MQVFVLGMHRSGTSALARVLNLMGLHFGGENAGTGRNRENPKGFWERRDVRDLNDAILHRADCDWDCVSSLDLDALDDDSRRELVAGAGDIVMNLDAHRPWFVKEPRLCVLFPIWREALEFPVCIHIVRSPVDVARSLSARNALAENVGLALWEFYNCKALAASASLPRLFVSYEELLRDPLGRVAALHGALAEFGYPLRLPQPAELTSFLAADLRHQQAGDDALLTAATQSQRDLYQLLQAGLGRDAPTPAPSVQCLATLREHDAAVDLDGRIEQANLRQRSRGHANLEQQLRLKQVELDHALEARREAERRSSAMQQEALERLARESDLRLELALIEAERKKVLATVDRAARALPGEVSRVRAEIGVLGTRSGDVIESLQMLLASRRWRLGNALVSAPRRLLLRASASPAEELALIASRHEARRTELRAGIQAAPGLARYTAERVEGKSGDEERTAVLIENRLLLHFGGRERKAQADFVRAVTELAERVIASRRWRLGHFLLSLPQRLLLRPAPPTVANHLRELIARNHSAPPAAPRPQPAPQAADSAQRPALPLPRPPPRRWRPLPPAPAYLDTRVDIVVCVHNALEHVQRCLASVLSRTTVDYRLVLVNDGSDAATTTWLRRFADDNDAELVATDGPLGYTVAANRGLKASTAPHVVLLNSDTVVPRLWLEGLLECMASGESVGIVGPLSNAASWQSVPQVVDAGRWAVNELPPGYRVDDFAELVRVASQRRFPRVELVNGFCLLIRRAVIERAGYLDEEAFPRGYGEENDYCLRARAAGFELAIADQCFVYHAKSQSFGAERAALAKAGGETLRARYSLPRIEAATRTLAQSRDLEEMRSRIASLLGDGVVAVPDAAGGRRTDGPESVLFVLPVRGGSGGANSVIQEMTGMRAFGIDAAVATPAAYVDDFRRFYGDLMASGGSFLFYESDQELLDSCAPFDVVVATLWSTPSLIAPVAERWPQKLYVYYVQDYEPWFFPQGAEHRAVAYDSYTVLPEAALMAKTDWLCRTVREKHGQRVYRVAPSLDHDVYHPQPAGAPAARDEAVTVAAMIRPSTPRRAPLDTLRALRAVSQAAAGQGTRVRSLLFGCESKDLTAHVRRHAPDLKLDFDYRNHGVLAREEVADLLRQADVFVDFSEYQAFGRTGIEAMACGCAVVLPQRGGVDEYAEHDVNAVLVDTADPQAMAQALRELVLSAERRRRLSENGLATAANYSIRRASLSELSVFRLAWRARQARRELPDAAYPLGAGARV